jgi:hypothetical protein
MGHLGWTEREYYESSPEAVDCAFEGYFNKREVEESWFRNVAAIMHGTMGGKDKIDQIWKIGKQEKITVKLPTPEDTKRILNRFKKNKDG